MLGLKMLTATIMLTFVLFNGGIAIKTAYGQSDSPFANCIQMIFEGDAVQLVTDSDCNDQQFIGAVEYYKANGYPIEDSYMDLIGSKLMTLHSQEFTEALK